MTQETDHSQSQPNLPHQPSLREMIQLDAPAGVCISPNGLRVAIKIRKTNWQENAYETIVQIHDLVNEKTFQLNRTGSIRQVEWVTDETMAVIKAGPGDARPQVFLYEGLMGEGWQVTDHKTGVDWFKPFAGGIIYLGRDPEKDENKPRTDRFGKYQHVEQEPSASTLYYLGLEELKEYEAQRKTSTEDEAKELALPVVPLSLLLDEPLSIQRVIPSPVFDAIYLNCWPRDQLVYYRDTSSFCIHLNAAEALKAHLRQEKEKKQEKEKHPVPEGSQEPEKKKEDYSYLGKITRLNLPRAASIAEVSPDGTKLIISHQERDIKMYTQADFWWIDREIALNATDSASFLSEMHNFTRDIDQEIYWGQWAKSGLFCEYPDGTRVQVARLEEDGQVTPLHFDDIFSNFNTHVSDAGRLALVASSPKIVSEVFVAEPEGQGTRWQTRQITHFGKATEDWDLGTVETIRWKSRDGVEIEGVLRKPVDFDPNHQYPLVFVVHGGPTSFSAETLLSGEERGYYPAIQLVQKGFLVLKPNYRGSVGRGQNFMELNVNNLGVGDLWDLESAIDYLVDLGWVDPERVGCMGWSQGGYISAFVGLHSDRFKAVSVGAGISDWYTYHISNDIPDFTIDYLSGSPFRNREFYEKTAPIHNIASARTPMLIQHGTDDQRVPFSNAMELYRGLKEMGVPVQLFAFPGMGHPITKPRENHAVMHQNLAWFSHYLLGEELGLE